MTTPDRTQSHLREDGNLAAQAQNDISVFGQLYERYIDRIFAYCMVRTGNRQDAQDITSEVFLAAIENIKHYDSRRSFIAWLFGIAHHKVVDYYRHKPYTTSLETVMNIAEPGESTEKKAEQHIQFQVAAQAIKTLNPDQAEAVTLRIFAELSTSEVSLVMGKSEAAVKMLVYRAVENLQNRLSPKMEVIS
jgi:RNA polymerase sigma-70 factor (ECF subfamily)